MLWIRARKTKGQVVAERKYGETLKDCVVAFFWAYRAVRIETRAGIAKHPICGTPDDSGRAKFASRICEQLLKKNC